MRAKAMDNKIKVIVFIFLMVLASDFSAKGDIGGGSGIVITPYIPDKEVKADEVDYVKLISKRNRTIEELRLKGTQITQYGENVGLMYVKDLNISYKPFFEFKGTTETGDKMTIDFSEVKSFTLLKIDNRFFAKDRVLLQIIQFPNISPEALLSKEPGYSYSKLKKDSTKIVLLWISSEDEENRELCIVGVKWSAEREYEILSKLSEIQLNTEVVLGYGNFEVESIGRIPSIWWAIPSVIQDEHYPYKQYQLR